MLERTRELSLRDMDLPLDVGSGDVTIAVPKNITLVPPPPRRPELNPTENLWQSMR